MNVFSIYSLLYAFGGALVLAGSVSEGGTCTTDNDHVDPSNHRFISDCDEKTFCSSSVNGTCKPRLCRRDEFPFGYQVGDTLPPLCPRGLFCPDQGNSCQDLIPIGWPCQLNRDYQCAPPATLAYPTSNQGSDGSLCLRSICTSANATLGQRCFLDSTTYVDLGPDGEQFSVTVTRHNCRTPRLYCNPSALQCLPVKSVGLSCSSDQECESLDCNSAGLCAYPPEMPLKVEPWQFAVTVLVVVSAMTVIVSALVIIHKRIRMQRYRDIQEYYESQLSLRRSMFTLHNVAAQRLADEKFHSDAYDCETLY